MAAHQLPTQNGHHQYNHLDFSELFSTVALVSDSGTERISQRNKLGWGEHRDMMSPGRVATIMAFPL